MLSEEEGYNAKSIQEEDEDEYLSQVDRTSLITPCQRSQLGDFKKQQLLQNGRKNSEKSFEKLEKSPVKAAYQVRTRKQHREQFSSQEQDKAQVYTP
jgi:hypothetical protein